MFYLTRNADLLESYRATRAERERAEESLADSSAGLVFQPEEHRYFLGKREMASVSSIVEYYAPFDAVQKSINASLNPRHPLFGKDPEEIRAIWQEAGRQAADAGTDLHAFGEACYLYMIGREDDIDSQFYDRIYPEGLMAIDPKEISLARSWAENDWVRYAPVAKETRIVNTELGYAGTFDLLLYDRYNYSYPVRDYKSNKDLDRWIGGEMLRPPLSMLKHNDIGKYTVQQTLYTIQLRRCGLNVNSNSLIWLKEDGYEERALEMQYDRVVNYAAQTYLQSIKNK